MMLPLPEMAELYINGNLAVRADFNAPLPYTSGYWMLAHRSWYSDREKITIPRANKTTVRLTRTNRAVGPSTGKNISGLSAWTP